MIHAPFLARRFAQPFSRILGVAATAAAVASTSLLCIPVAAAQSPAPTLVFKVYQPGGSMPSGYNALQVEGVGLGTCAGPSLLTVEQATTNFVNEHIDTVTEISPQSGCVSNGISSYEGYVNTIYTYVESHTSDPGRYWGGFEMDEETGFGFGAPSLQSLNQWVQNLMMNAPGMSWYFTQDFSGAYTWSLSTYNNIILQSWPAPQVYTSYMAYLASNACGGPGYCDNLVTATNAPPPGGYPCASSPYNNPSSAIAAVSGVPWSNGYWSSGYWWAFWNCGYD